MYHFQLYLIESKVIVDLLKAPSELCQHFELIVKNFVNKLIYAHSFWIIFILSNFLMYLITELQKYFTGCNRYGSRRPICMY